MGASSLRHLSTRMMMLTLWTSTCQTIQESLQLGQGKGRNHLQVKERTFLSPSTFSSGGLKLSVRVVMRWSPETPNPLECPTSEKGLFSDTDDLAFKVDMTSSGGMLGLAQLGPVDNVEPLPLPAPRDC